MINDYSLPKVFYEDLYEVFIFHVKHPRKVFILKKYEFNLTLKKAVLKKDIYIKKKSGVYLTEKMDEVRARNKIEVEVHQEKVDFINDAYEKE